MKTPTWVYSFRALIVLAITATLLAAVPAVAQPGAAAAQQPTSMLFSLPGGGCTGDLCGGAGVGNTNPGGPTPSNPPGGPSAPGGGDSGGGGGGGGAVPVDYFSSHGFVYKPTPLTAGNVPSCLGACSAYETGARDSYGGRCAPPRGNEWGEFDGVEYMEAGYLARGDDTGDETSSQGFRVYTAAWYSCISAAAWRDTPLNCPQQIGLTVTGPMRNPAIQSSTFYTAGPDVTPFWASDRTDETLCASNMQIYRRVDLVDYGQYLMEITGLMARCTLRTYFKVDNRTRNVPEPEIIACAGGFNYPLPDFRAQLFCPRPGWTPDWSGNHSFTPEECLTEDPGVWNCGPQVNVNPRYDGADATDVEVLDDGKMRRLRWQTPVLQGVRNVTARRARMLYVGGTPFRDGERPAGDTQPFVSENPMNEWRSGWRGVSTTPRRTDYRLNFQAPGFASEPFQARPQWYFEGEFRVVTVSYTSFNPETGAYEGGPSGTAWRPMSATCQGIDTGINVHRARNSTS